MRGVVIIIICLTCFVAVNSSVNADSKQSNPVLCTQPSYDFGKEESYRVLEHTFTIENTSDQIVMIKSVEPSCGCARANANPRHVLPGQNAEVDVLLSLRGRSGSVRESVLLTTDHSESPYVLLKIQGTATNNILVEPHTAIFGDIPDDEKRKLQVKVTIQKEGLELLPEKMAIRGEGFSGRMQRLNSNGYAIDVVSSPSGPKGARHGVIMAPFKDDILPPIQIPVTANIVGHVVAHPNEIIILDRNRRDDVVTRMMRVHALKSGEAFEVERIETPDSRMVVEVVALEPKQSYLIKITNIPVDAGLDHKSVRIITNHSKTNVIDVPIHVRSAYPTKKE